MTELNHGDTETRSGCHAQRLLEGTAARSVSHRMPPNFRPATSPLAGCTAGGALSPTTAAHLVRTPQSGVAHRRSVRRGLRRRSGRGPLAPERRSPGDGGGPPAPGNSRQLRLPTATAARPSLPPSVGLRWHPWGSLRLAPRPRGQAPPACLSPPRFYLPSHGVPSAALSVFVFGCVQRRALPCSGCHNDTPRYRGLSSLGRLTGTFALHARW